VVGLNATFRGKRLRKGHQKFIRLKIFLFLVNPTFRGNKIMATGL